MQQPPRPAAAGGRLLCFQRRKQVGRPRRNYL